MDFLEFELLSHQWKQAEVLACMEREIILPYLIPNYIALYPLTQVIILMHSAGSDPSVQIQAKPLINEKSNKSFTKFPNTFQNFV